MISDIGIVLGTIVRPYEGQKDDFRISAGGRHEGAENLGLSLRLSDLTIHTIYSLDHLRMQPGVEASYNVGGKNIVYADSEFDLEMARLLRGGSIVVRPVFGTIHVDGHVNIKAEQGGNSLAKVESYISIASG